MRRFNLVGLGLWLVASLAGIVRAETFQLLDGTSVTGEIVMPPKPDGVNVRVATGTYKFVGWTNLSQAALQELARNPKLAPSVEPYIEADDTERIRKTEVVIKPPPRLERPPKGSLLGALLGSSVGFVTLLLLYGANVYAGYEIAVVRAYPPTLVCGIAAIPVLGLVGNIVFLCLPTRMEAGADTALEAAAAPHDELAAPLDPDASVPHSTLHLADEKKPASSALPETQVFKRGQFTFNRRFIETKFAGFFGVVRRDTEKDMVLQMKTARGDFVAHRITRIAANDLHIEIRKGGATSEIQIPFVEIQEIQLKHKDA